MLHRDAEPCRTRLVYVYASSPVASGPAGRLDRQYGVDQDLSTPAVEQS